MGKSKTTSLILSALVLLIGTGCPCEPPDGMVHHGTWAFYGELDSGQQSWMQQVDPQALADFENLAGKQVDILTMGWFLEWDFPTASLNEIVALGKTPHLGVTTGFITPSVVMSGVADSHLVEWAKAAQQFNQPLFFRLWPEMNGDWNVYSASANPMETTDLYRAAWQRIWTIFQNQGALRVVWVWAPVAVDYGGIHWTDYYPGDDYVDWVGMSVYSFMGDGEPGTLIEGVYSDYADTKPIMVTEGGAADADGVLDVYNPGTTAADNPEIWINHFFDAIESSYPRVKAFVWFNRTDTNPNIMRVFDLQEAQQKSDAYRARVANSRYGVPVSCQ